MKQNWTLIAGIFLLATGIITRRTTEFEITGLILIITGILYKGKYIVDKSRSGEYQPGKELLFLAAGLGMFLLGLYFRSAENVSYAIAMVIVGLSLKLVFIILFIIKIRAKTKELNSK